MRHMRSSTAVQLPEPTEIAKNDFALADPAGHRKVKERPPGPVKPVSVDLLVSDHTWVDNYAAYLNSLDDLEVEEHGPSAKRGKGTRQTRKSLCEGWVDAGVLQAREEVQHIIEQLGEFPPADDKLAVKRYAKRALALANKKSA